MPFTVIRLPVVRAKIPLKRMGPFIVYLETLSSLSPPPPRPVSGCYIYVIRARHPTTTLERTSELFSIFKQLGRQSSDQSSGETHFSRRSSFGYIVGFLVSTRSCSHFSSLTDGPRFFSNLRKINMCMRLVVSFYWALHFCERFMTMIGRIWDIFFFR